MSDAVGLIGSWALNIIVIIVSICFICGMTIVLAKLLITYKRYSQFTCIVWGRDGFGQTTETKDRAGIFVDRKTLNKRFFMKKANVGLDPDNVPYIQQGNKKVVYLLKTGLKNFRYVKPRINNPNLVLEVGEEDVNWAINAYERQKKIFNQNILLQYMPFIALAFVSIIILIMFIYFFKQFGTLAKVASSLSEAARAYAQAHAGTVVLN